MPVWHLELYYCPQEGSTFKASLSVGSHQERAQGASLYRALMCVSRWLSQSHDNIVSSALVGHEEEDESDEDVQTEEEERGGMDE